MLANDVWIFRGADRNKIQGPSANTDAWTSRRTLSRTGCTPSLSPAMASSSVQRSFSDIATVRFTSLLRPTASLKVAVYFIVAIVLSFVLVV
jgi:hypothetical protein